MVVLFLIFLALVGVATAASVVSAPLGLGLIPPFTGSDSFFIVKNYLADVVLWSLASVILLACWRIFRERRSRRTQERAEPTQRSLPSNPVIAVALTAYNDELSIGDAVEDFKKQPGVETVIVVDNNCRDRTVERARAAGAVTVTETNQGYGYACIRGLRAALHTDADIVVLSEGDGTFSGRDIAKLVPFLEDVDLVVGNRTAPALVDRSSQMDSFLIWGNQVGAKLLQMRFWDWRFLGKLRLSDLGCTYRAMRHETVREIIDELSVGGNHFSPHMIMVVLSKGLAVVEVPVTFRPRVGVSKGASSLAKGVAIGLAMLWHIMSFPLEGRRGPPKRPTAPARERPQY